MCYTIVVVCRLAHILYVLIKLQVLVKPTISTASSNGTTQPATFTSFSGSAAARSNGPLKLAAAQLTSAVTGRTFQVRPGFGFLP